MINSIVPAQSVNTGQSDLWLSLYRSTAVFIGTLTRVTRRSIVTMMSVSGIRVLQRLLWPSDASETIPLLQWNDDSRLNHIIVQWMDTL